MTPSSQPSSSTSEAYANYGLPWQGYDLHQGVYGWSQMFLPPQFPGQGPSSPAAPRVPPEPPANHSVNQPTFSSSTPPPHPPSGTPVRYSIILPTKRFLPPAEQWIPGVAAIVDMPSLPDMSYDEYDAVDESQDSSDLGSAEGKPPISLKQTEFSLKHFAKKMGQPNIRAFNKWRKVWVVWCLEKKHRSIIRGRNRLKQV
jgi:hypothetical protein